MVKRENTGHLFYFTSTVSLVTRRAAQPELSEIHTQCFSGPASKSNSDFPRPQGKIKEYKTKRLSERCALNETGHRFSTPPVRAVSLRMWQPNNSSKKRLNEGRERERNGEKERDGVSDSANYGAPHFSDPSQFMSLSLSPCWRNSARGDFTLAGLQHACGNHSSTVKGRNQLKLATILI